VGQNGRRHLHVPVEICKSAVHLSTGGRQGSTNLFQGDCGLAKATIRTV
jgi:hypothetical protein